MMHLIVGGGDGLFAASSVSSSLRYFVWSFLCTAHITSLDYDRYAYPVAEANRRWRCPFRYRGSRRESAVAQLSTLGHFK
jgi:hypothetical protein